MVLMDYESTHNFLSSHVPARPCLRPTHTGLLRVTVVNRGRLSCIFLCAGMLLWIQGEMFVIDVFLLPLNVCDVVLGTQWLRTLGPIFWDFERLFMRFSWRGREVELRGVRPPLNRVEEEKSLGREFKRKWEGWLCQIVACDRWDMSEG